MPFVAKPLLSLGRLRLSAMPVLGLGVAAALCLGCGVGRADARWIGEDSAAVRCTVAGSQLQLPPLFLEVPSPTPPTGLFARSIEPIALDALGFTRDSAVCAALEAPSEDTIAEAAVGLQILSDARADLGAAVREVGPCGCEGARMLEIRGLVPGCTGVPTRRDCELSRAQLDAIETAAAPVRKALADAPMPWIHWRLFGSTDRIGRFAAVYEQLLRFHDGGSEVYLPGAPIPKRGNRATLLALLEQPDVVAVVRQDSGRALLVVREIRGRWLVLDHFAYPALEPSVQPVLPFIDDAQIDRRIAMLAPPETPRRPLLDAAWGTLAEMDRGLLDRVDRGMIAATKLNARPYREPSEQRTAAPAMFDRVAVQVPFGREGKDLRLRARMSADGQTWIDSAAKGKLREHLRQLGEAEVSPNFRAGAGAPDFVLRGADVEVVWFLGATGLVRLLAALEEEASGRVTGSVGSWAAEIPSGPLPLEFKTRGGLQSLRERLSLDAHRLEGTLTGDTVDLVLRPK